MTDACTARAKLNKTQKTKHNITSESWKQKQGMAHGPGRQQFQEVHKAPEASLQPDPRICPHPHSKDQLSCLPSPASCQREQAKGTCYLFSLLCAAA